MRPAYPKNNPAQFSGRHLTLGCVVDIIPLYERQTHDTGE
jgi:hypothetical protein